jgi:hypothetical protein
MQRRCRRDTDRCARPNHRRPSHRRAGKAGRKARRDAEGGHGISPCGQRGIPTAVAPKYSKETEGKARMHTCLDQYNANKATNANGGLNWIQKGGGYYSECNKRLKG